MSETPNEEDNPGQEQIGFGDGDAEQFSPRAEKD